MIKKWMINEWMNEGVNEGMKGWINKGNEGMNK